MVSHDIVIIEFEGAEFLFQWSVRFIVVMAELVSALTSAAALQDMEGCSAKKVNINTFSVKKTSKMVGKALYQN